jgi:hypothetical protein
VSAQQLVILNDLRKFLESCMKPVSIFDFFDIGISVMASVFQHTA